MIIAQASITVRCINRISGEFQRVSSAASRIEKLSKGLSEYSRIISPAIVVTSCLTQVFRLTHIMETLLTVATINHIYAQIKLIYATISATIATWGLIAVVIGTVAIVAAGIVGIYGLSQYIQFTTRARALERGVERGISGLRRRYEVYEPTEEYTGGIYHEPW